jgi:hypothetical protein
MGLTVVGLAGSTCTGRVLATLFEKNVEDFEVKPVDFASGEHKKPEFLKLQVSSSGLEDFHLCLQLEQLNILGHCGVLFLLLYCV